MTWKASRSAFLLTFGLFALTLTAAASPLKWDITLTSTGGQTVSGFLQYDPSQAFNSLNVTDWSFNLDVTNEITTNGVGFGAALNPIGSGGYTLNASNASLSPAQYGSNAFDLLAVNTNASGSTILNQLSFTLTGYPGQLNTGYSAFFIQNEGTNSDGSTKWAGVNFASGSSVLVTPEPSSWVLGTTGVLLLLGVSGWKRRRTAA